MICPTCGHEIPATSRICANCGAVIVEGQAQPARRVSPGVEQGPDGVLRWVYELNMWKNPTVLITTWKVLLLSSLAVAFLAFIFRLGDGFGKALLMFLEIGGIVFGIVTGLMLLAYPIVALVNGGKYCVLFEMDEQGVKHVQMQKQFTKSQVLSMIVALAGAASGNIQATAAGLLAASRQSMLSRFDKVRSITVNEKRSVIYVNERLMRNQVYADAADFAFVRDYLIDHCGQAKVTHQK